MKKYQFYLIAFLAGILAGFVVYRIQQAKAESLIAEPPWPKPIAPFNADYLKLRDDLIAKYEKGQKLEYQEAVALIKMWNDKLQELKRQGQTYKFREVKDNKDFINKLNQKIKE